MTFDSIPADKEVSGIKFLYRYDKASADAAVARITEDLGKQYVNVFEGKDLRGRNIFKIIVTNPQAVTNLTEDELAGVTSNNPFETLSAYLQGQRRIKFKRKSLIESNISEFRRKGKDTKVLEARMVKLLSDIAELETNIEAFIVAKDAESLKILAAKQIAWVSSILGKEDITTSEITEANYIIDLWRDIREILYEDIEQVPDDMLNAFEQITALVSSDDIRGNLLRVMGANLANRAKYPSAKALFEEFYKVEDSSILREWGLDLSQTGIRLITNTDIMLRDTLERAEQEIIIRSKEIQDKFNDIKKEHE
jgi:hypothetical protein